MPPVEGRAKEMLTSEPAFLIKYCRMCALELKSGVFIFGEEGKRLQVSEKIRKTVSILVLEEDLLPKRICTDCCSSLEDYAHYKDTVLDAQEKLALIAKQIEKASAVVENAIGSASKNSSETSLTSKELASPLRTCVSPLALVSDRAGRRACYTSGIDYEEFNKSRNEDILPASSPVAFRCGSCSESTELFTSNDALIAHSVRSHEDISGVKYKCRICCALFENLKNLLPHMGLHETENGSPHSPSDSSKLKIVPKKRALYPVLAKTASFSCKECGKRFNTMTGLESHAATKHLQQRDMISNQATFAALEDNVKDDDFSCGDPNDLDIPDDESVADASAGHSGESISKFSGKDLSKPADIIMVNARDCNFPGTRKLTSSTDECGSTQALNEASKLEEKKALHEKELYHSKVWNCNICDKVFHSSNGYQSHKLSHEGKRFDCDECTASYMQKATLTHHKNVHHGRGSKPYKCSWCSKDFYEAKFLNQHLKTHASGNQDFKCEICTKAFRTMRCLRRHVMLHSSVKKYSCSLCNKAFRVKSKLNEHENTHTSKKPLGCLFCDKAFNCYPNYAKHVKRKHASEIQHQNKVPQPRKLQSASFKKTGSSDGRTTNALSEVDNAIQCNSHQPAAQAPPVSSQMLTSAPIPAPAHNQEYSFSSLPSHQLTYSNKPFAASIMQSGSVAHASNGINQPLVNALDLVDCAIQNALVGESTSTTPNAGNFEQTCLPPQNKRFDLNYKLESSGFQDMPMELTKVFQRDPLELCVRQDLNQLVDLSSRVDQPQVSSMNVGMAVNNFSVHKLDHEFELVDLSGPYRQPMDLISRTDDTPNDLYSEGSLVDLSLRSGFVQDQSASSFLRELIDLSARSDSIHGGELDLTKSTHSNQAHHQQAHFQSHHQSSCLQLTHAHVNTSPKSGNSFSNVVYPDAIFGLQS